MFGESLCILTKYFIILHKTDYTTGVYVKSLTKTPCDHNINCIEIINYSNDIIILLPAF